MLARGEGSGAIYIAPGKLGLLRSVTRTAQAVHVGITARIRALANKGY